MSIIAIDIGTTTTKIIEFSNEQIASKEIFLNKNLKKNLNDFINKYKINMGNIEYIAVTGIGADKVKFDDYKVPIKIVEEFEAIAKGGQYLSKKDEILVVSIGTGTALVRTNKNEFKHLGGTGVGAGTLTNLCKVFANTNSFEEIVEMSKKGDLKNIDIKIEDITNKNIHTLPLDLTLSNFGKIEENAKKEDIILGIVNMVFEIIGMMAAFSLKNDTIKDIALIGNIVKIPQTKAILEKIEKTQGVSFIIPENAEYAVALGAIKNS